MSMAPSDLVDSNGMEPAWTSDDLSDPRLYLNRELSWLEFNRRVLALALDPAIPLLERLRFLTITSTNLDEFFEVRAAAHKERASYGADVVSFDGLTSQQTLRAIKKLASEIVREQYHALNDVLLPLLEAEGVRLVARPEWTPAQVAWLRDYFRGEVQPVLTPVGLDPAHPFPRIANKSLNFVVQVAGADAFGRDTELAVVQVARALPRLIRLPEGVSLGQHDYVMLSSVVQAHIDELFPGMSTRGCYQFRVTRNAELWVDEEEVDDILKALKGELPERSYSEAVRLEVADDCPSDVASFLLGRFGLDQEALYRVHGPVNLHRLEALYHEVDRPDLKYEQHTPRLPRRLHRGDAIFEAIRQGDVLLHHPYQSFQPVLELLRQAAVDPSVLAVKMTLYRTSKRSPVVEALIEAARAGKQVTVVVELRARFDEAENIDLATRLQEVGANVVYGVVGYKTHSKMLLVVRREGGALRRYVHLATGNYHPGTARAYTDISYLTAREDVGEDVHRIFNHLTGVGQVTEPRKLLHSPFTLHKTLLQLIDDEIKIAQRGEPARIAAKVNALTERAMIQALYRASRAGVKIDLIVRGACCLRPGVPGVSDNIRVRCILGRFLEHSRVYYFRAGGAERVYCGSADWMARNLLGRVEVCFPIEDEAIKRRLIKEDLEVYFADQVQAWVLQASGDYALALPSGASARDAQRILMAEIGASDDLQPEGEGLHDDRPGEDAGGGRWAQGQIARRKDKAHRRAEDEELGGLLHRRAAATKDERKAKK